MKTALTILMIVLAVLATGCTSQAPAAPAATPAVTTGTPDLVGIWTGTTVGHSKIEGFRDHATPRFNISEQKGQAFSGTKEYTRGDGKVYTEKFSGVISGNNELSFADHGLGITLGRMTGTNAMELRYIEDGPDAKAYIILLTKQKN
jgi:hypothetical protein